MATPEELETRASNLRGYAAAADVKAQALATHIDSIATTSCDESVWKGAYPSKANGDLKIWKQGLGKAADLLGHDAEAWRKKAREYDSRAQQLRAEQAKAAQAKAAKSTPGGN